jgi:hypothetical protein
MPILLWVTFWSSLLGAASCFGDATKPVRIKARNDLD